MKIVIDCNNLAYRARYTTGLLNNGIVFGFMKQLFKLAKDFENDGFVFCWDSQKSYRKLEYSEYKENRRKDRTPEEREEDDLVFIQFQSIKDMLFELGFRNIFLCSGYEADDLIAHVVQRFPDNYIIVSSDNDLYQLLNRSNLLETKIWDLAKKKLFTWEDFERGYGLTPSEWPMVKAIAGCSGDNVKGITGVGEITAIKYIVGSMADGKVKERVDSPDGMAIVNRNYLLVTLPYGGLKPIGITEIVDDELYALDFMDAFNKMGFVSFLHDESFNEWKEYFGLLGGRV